MLPSQVRRFIGAASLLVLGCGGGAHPATAPDTVVPLDDGAAGAKSTSPAPAASPDVQRAMKAIEAQHFEEAKSLLEGVLAKNPKDAQAHYYMGVARAGLQDPAGARQQFEAALAGDPQLLEAYVNLSAIDLELKDGAAALSAAERGLKLAPKHPQLTLNRALALEASGNKAAALVAYGDAVKANPDDFTLHTSYAQLLLEAGKKAEAVSEISVVRRSDDVRLLAVAATVARQAGAPAECVATLDRALAVKPHAALHVRRGLCREDVKDLAGAKSDYEAALRLDAKFAPAYHYLGKLKQAAGDKKAACTDLLKAAELGGKEGVGPEAKQLATQLGCH